MSCSQRFLPTASYIWSLVSTTLLIFACGSAAIADSDAQTNATSAGGSSSNAANVISMGRRLDHVSRKLDQYGAITLSAPLLVRAANDGTSSVFAFDLGKTAKDYFQDAQQNIQGKVASFNESIMDIEAQRSLRQDPTLAAAYREALAERQATIESKQESAAAAKVKYDAAISAANQAPDLAARSTKIAAAVDSYRNELKEIYGEPGRIPSASSIGSPPNPTSLISSPQVSGTSSLSSSEGAFALLQSLGSAKPTITDRAAIIGAAGDNTVAGIFQILGDPGNQLALSGQQAFFGVTMVSVIPGRRTEKKFYGDVSVVATIKVRKAEVGEVKNLLERWQRDYGLSVAAETRIACDSELSGECRRSSDVANFVSEAARSKILSEQLPLISATEAYDALPAALKGGIGSVNGTLFDTCSVQNLEDRASCYLGDTDDLPTVAAVSPMTDAQVLDYGSSSRRRRQIALDLASAMRNAGDEEAARIFAQYATQVETDAVSRAPQNFVAAYSSGRVFGYEVGPGFTALGDPSSRKAKPGKRLQRQSFPALIIIGIKPDLAQTKVYLVANKKLMVITPSLYLAQTSRWVPRGFLNSRLFRIREDKREHWARTLDKALQASQQLTSTAASVLYNRATTLEALTGFSDATVPLPEPEAPHAASAPKLRSISPRSFALNSDAKGKAIDTSASFVIQGDDVDGLASDPTVLLNGKPISGASFVSYGSAGLLRVPLHPSDTGLMFVSFPEESRGDRHTTRALVGPVEIQPPGKK